MSLAVFEAKTIKLNGHTFTYQDEGTGPVLLLIHGSLCDYRYWRWQVPELAQHCRVIAPSLRHFWPGSIDDPADFNYSQHAQDMADLLLQLGISQAHILGHSRGAAIAMQMALAHPSVVQSLILADPGLRTNEQLSESIQFKQESLRLIQEGELDQGLSLFIDTVSGPGTYKRMVRWFREMVKDNANTLFRQRYEPPFLFDAERFQQIQLPTTLIGGSHSPAPFPEINRLLAQVWLHAQSHVLDPASHGMNLALPHEFNRCILEHITQ